MVGSFWVVFFYSIFCDTIISAGHGRFIWRHNKVRKAFDSFPLLSGDDRKALEKDIKYVNQQLKNANTKISNLASAIAEGADVSLLLNTQNEIKAEIRILELRRDELNQTLAAMPNPEAIKKDTMYLRILLMEKLKKREIGGKYLMTILGGSCISCFQIIPVKTVMISLWD